MKIQLLIGIEKDIKNKFQAATALKGDKMGPVINSFIMKYLEENDEEIKGRKLKREQDLKEKKEEKEPTKEELEEIKIWGFNMRKRVEDSGKTWVGEETMGIEINEEEYNKWKFANQ